MGLAIWMGFTMTNYQYHFHQTVTWSLQDVGLKVLDKRTTAVEVAPFGIDGQQIESYSL